MGGVQRDGHRAVAPVAAQLPDKIETTGKPILRLFRERPRDRGAVRRGEAGQIRRFANVLHQQLLAARAIERPDAGEQFLIHDRQAVLIAIPGEFVLKCFRGAVHGRDAAGDHALDTLEVLDQAEIRHLDVTVHQEQVLGLDVQVLKLVLIVHQVQHFRGLLQESKQFDPGNAGEILGATLAKAIPQVAVRQLGDDQQLALNDVVTFEREQVGMSDRLKALQGAQLLLGMPGSVLVDGSQVAVDDLDGLHQAARSLRLPNLAKAAAANSLQQAIARNGFDVRLDTERHSMSSQNEQPASSRVFQIRAESLLLQKNQKGSR